MFRRNLSLVFIMVLVIGATFLSFNCSESIAKSAFSEPTTTTIPKVADPTFSIESGTTFKSSIIVDLSCVTKNAVIMYSFDNITWITGKIVLITETTTLYVKAKLNGMADSDVVSATYINTNITTTSTTIDESTTTSILGTSTSTTILTSTSTTSSTSTSISSTTTSSTIDVSTTSTSAGQSTTTTDTYVSTTTSIIAPSSTSTTILTSTSTTPLTSTSTSTSSTSTTTTTTINGKEINIKFYDINVEDGTTDFNIGETVYGTPKDLVFTIENKGNQNIILSGTPIKVSLTGDCFSLKADVGASIILPGNSTTFTVKFDPTYNADLDTEWSASIMIPNDDDNENPYNFTIKGKGVINPEAGVEYNSSIISDNATDYLLTFPNGFTNNLKFTIKNIGVGNLKLTGSPKIALSGSEFSLIQDAEEIIADGGYSEFIVKFSPTGSGTYTGNISIASNDIDNNPYNFSFKIVLESYEPEINVKMGGINITDESSNIDIGELLYDTTKDVTFTVENIGTADLYLIGNPIIDFSGNCFTLIDTIDNPVIVPSGFASFTIRFAPNVSNGSAEYIGTVSILNSDTDEDTYNWTIKGASVINPEMNIKDGAVNIPDGTSNYDLGSVKYGEPKDIIFTIENSGIGDLLLTGSPRVAVSGTGFSLKSDATSIIGQGSSTTFTVTFTPPSSFGGNYSGSVSITNNDSNESPYNFSVIAVGLMNPEIGIKEGSNNIPNETVDYDLGSTMYGTPKDITFTIENTGFSLLAISGTPRVTVTGAGFTLKTDVLANIATGASSNFVLTFTPTADGGSYSGTVTINSNDVDESVYTFSIKATGIIAPEINVKCGELDIEDGSTDVNVGSYMLNEASDITFTIENTGIGNIKVTGAPRVSVSGDFFSLKTDAGNIINQGSGSTFVLTFNPLYEGEYPCNISISNNDSDEEIYNFDIKVSVIKQLSYMWSKTTGSRDYNELGYSLITDINNNIYYTGKGLQNSRSCSLFGKIDLNGSVVWEKPFGVDYGSPYPGSSSGRSIALDAYGNAYISGYFKGEVDFDPSSSQDTYGGSSYETYSYISKFSYAGDYNLSHMGVGSTYNGVENSVAVDKNFNLYSVDHSSNPIFYRVRKRNGDGTLIWSDTRESGSYNDYWNSIIIDNLDKIYVTGCISNSMSLIKYNNIGTVEWTKVFGVNSSGNSLSIDSGNNIYVTGCFSGTVDFDPGTEEDNITSKGGKDIFITKINNDGTYSWTKSLGGSNDDYGYSITFDSSNNLFLTGCFSGTADFDPSPLINKKTSLGGNDIFIAKFDGNCNYIWTKTIGGAGNDVGNSIKIDSLNNIYVTGGFENSVDFNISNIAQDIKTSNGLTDIFIMKIEQ